MNHHAQPTILTPKKPEYKKYPADLTQVLHMGNVFSPDECEALITEFGADMGEGELLDQSEGGKAFRDSKVKWIQPNETSVPFMDRLLKCVMQANTQFQFEIDSFEGFQLAQYGMGQHYDWHKDLGGGVAGHRKLSMSVQLSSPHDYNGGDLEFWFGKDHSHKAPRDQGGVIVFPSWELHRVTPVTGGTRWSLVTWSSGTYRFR